MIPSRADHRSSLTTTVRPLISSSTPRGDLLNRAWALLRSEGRVVSIAEDPPEPDESSGIHAIYFVVEPNREQSIEIAGSIDLGELRPWIDSVFPLEEDPAAFARSMERGTRGKVVLRVGDA